MRRNSTTASQSEKYRFSANGLRQSRSRSKSPPLHPEDVKPFSSAPSPHLQPQHPLDSKQTQVELLMAKVNEFAAKAPNHGLTELLNSLETILQSDQLGFKPSKEVANAVYRHILLSEKKKAYDSVVSLQSEIYSLQGKSILFLTSQDQKLGLDGQLESDAKHEGNRKDFTFAEILHESNSLQEGTMKVQASNWLKSDSLTKLHYTSVQDLPVAFISNLDNSLKINQLHEAINLKQTVTSSSQNSCKVTFPSKDKRDQNNSAHKKQKKPPLQISVSKTSNTCISDHNILKLESGKSGNIRQFLYNNSSNQAVTEMSQAASTQKTGVQGFLDKDPMMIMSNFQQTPSAMTTQSNKFNRHVLVDQLKDLINEKDQTDTFEIIEQVIQLKQNPAFARRCNKFKKMRQERRMFHVSPSETITHEHKNWLNTDLQSVFTFQRKNRSMPKLVLSKESDDSTSSSETLSSDPKKRSKSYQPRAVDSNKAILVAYQVRNLLLKGLKSLLQFKQEQESKKFLNEAIKQKLSSKLVRSTFKSFKTYFKQHAGHQSQKFQSFQFFKMTIGRVYLHNWRQLTQLKVREDRLMKETTFKLLKMKKLRLLKNWRASILEHKLLRFSYKAARRIVMQRTMTKAWHALRAFARYTIKDRYIVCKSQMGNTRRLKFKGFKSWQKYILKQHQKLSMQQLAQQLNEAALKRTAILVMREFLENQRHYHSLNQIADTFHEFQLKKQSLNNFKLYIKMHLFQQTRLVHIKKYYENVLKARLIKTLHLTNIEFIERSVHAEGFIQRRKKRVILILLKRFVKFNQSNLKVMQPAYYYISWLWLNKLQQNKSKLGFNQIKLERRLSNKYIEQERRATALLGCYYKQKVFNAWKNNCRKLLMLKQKFKQNKLIKIIDQWSSTAAVNCSIRNNYLKIKRVKDFANKLRVFRLLKLNRCQQKKMKWIASRVKKQTSRYLTNRHFQSWFNLYTQIDSKQTRKTTLKRAGKKLVFAKYLRIWQTRYMNSQKKKSLVQKKMKVEKGRKCKFFLKWMQEMNKTKQIQKQDIQVFNNHCKRKLFQVLKGLKSHCSARKHKQQLLSLLKQKAMFSTLVKIIRAWKLRIPELKQKKMLIQAVKFDFKLKIKQKVFDALKSRRDYTIEKSTTDAIMTNAIQTLTLRRFFKSWEGLMSRRLGLQLFADSFDKLQQRQFFKNACSIFSNHQQIEQHLHLYKDFKLLQSSLKALQRHAKRKDYLQSQINRCIQMQRRVLITHTFKQWANRINNINTLQKIAVFSVVAIGRVIKKQYFQILRQRKEQRKKIRFVRRVTLDNLLKSVFYNFRNVIYRSKLTKFVIAQRRRHIAKSIIVHLKQNAIQEQYYSQAMIAQMKVIKSQAVLKAWKKAFIRQRQHETILESCATQTKQSQKQNCFQALHSFTKRCQINRTRMLSIHSYQHQKQKLKVFITLLHYFQTSKQKSLNKSIASDFRRVSVWRQLFVQLKIYAMGMKCHRQCIKFIEKKRLLPKSVRALKHFYSFKKDQNKLKNKALSMVQYNRKVKAIQMFISFVQLKNVHKKITSRVKTLMESGLKQRYFSMWIKAQFLKQELKAKRYCLTKILQDVQQQWLVKSTFQRMLFETKTNIARNTQISMIAQSMQMKRIFTSWKNWIIYQNQLRSVKDSVSANHIVLIQSYYFTTLLKKTKGHRISKLKASKKQSELLLKCLKSLRLSVQLKKASLFADLWHNEFNQKAFIQALQDRVVRRKTLDTIQVEIQTGFDLKLMQKATLSLKYFVLSQKSAKLIQAKMDQKLKIKALDAFKYQTMANRVTHQFRKIKQSNLKHRMLKIWVSELAQVRKQKKIIVIIILRLHLRELNTALQTWKRTTFRQKFLQSLQQHLVFPKQAETAINCFKKWRKYSQFKRNAAYCLQQLQEVKQYQLKNKYLGVWLNQAVRQAPVRLFCTKLERLELVIGARKAFQTLQCLHETQLMRENAATQMIEERNFRIAKNVINNWKQKIKVIKAGQQIAALHNEQLLANCMYLWRAQMLNCIEQKREARLEEQACDQADNYYFVKQVKLSFTKLVYYLLRRRQKKQAQQFRNGQLAFNSFAILFRNAQQSKQKGSLRRKQRRFMANVSKFNVKKCFKSWFALFKEELLLREFKQYKQKKILSAFIAQLIVETNISQKLSKIGRHASIYFERRRQNNTAFECFNFLKSYATQKRIKQERLIILLDKAKEFRSDRLIEQTFMMWKTQVAMPEKNRSCLYTVFSGWKFYTKERVLLKKYLFECGESIGNMSLMTTLEMRDSVRKIIGNETSSIIKEPLSNESLSMEKSQQFYQRMYAFTNQSIEQKPRSEFQLQGNRSHSSLADKRFKKLQQDSNSYEQTISDEKSSSFDGKQTPMIMHKSAGHKSQH